MGSLFFFFDQLFASLVVFAAGRAHGRTWFVKKLGDSQLFYGPSFLVVSFSLYAKAEEVAEWPLQRSR